MLVFSARRLQAVPLLCVSEQCHRAIPVMYSQHSDILL